MSHKFIVYLIIIAVIVGGLGFYSGMQYQKTKIRQGFMMGRAGQRLGENPPGNGNPDRQRLFNQGNRPVSGEIISLDNSTLTLKSRDDSSKIVIYSDTTLVNKTASGSASDLKVGDNAIVMGAVDNNGIITAQNIFLGEQMLFAPLSGGVNNKSQNQPN